MPPSRGFVLKISEERPPAFDHSLLRRGRLPIAALIQTLRSPNTGTSGMLPTPFGLCPSGVQRGG